MDFRPFDPSQTLAVIGAGAMGRGIAQVAAQAGYRVIVADLADSALESARLAVTADLAKRVSRGKLSESEAGAISARFHWTTDYGDLSAATLVIEAIVESPEIKGELFRRLETIVSPQTIIATNTSSLSVTALARDLVHPSRFAGLHFFNPATVMRLVEIVRGAATAPDVGQRLSDLMEQWQKVPVLVRDVPGFIVNRVARPYYAEGFRAVTEGVAPVEVIDHVMRVNGGFRMGPLELADLIGHDVNYAVAQSVYAACFGQTRFVPQSAQGDLVLAGRLGRKTRRGFYDYSQPTPTVEGMSRASVLAIAPPDLSTPWSVDVDGVHVQANDGRSALRISADLSKPVALIDWSRDLKSAATLAIAGSDDRALDAAMRLAATCGKAAVTMADRPGLLSLRMVCQLANAAADAVRDRVATPADIDQAMVHGVNHPSGPLATSASIGHARVVAALTYIAEETGEAMYQPSEQLRRLAWSAS